MKKVFSVIIFVCSFAVASDEYFISRLKNTVPLTDGLAKRLCNLGPRKEGLSHVTSFQNNQLSLPLYQQYPALQNSLARVELAELPTPINYLDTFSDRYAHGAHVYIKRDDLTGKTIKGKKQFGGNKIRKLEFLLGDALNQGAKTVMTYGCIGSNHATATASCAQQLGLRCITILKPQPLSWVVQRNLLLMHEYGADMILVPSVGIRCMQTVCSFVHNKYTYGDFPYFIPTGGSDEIGAMGFVNAAFELKEQIDAGLLPMPDVMYLPLGSCGTASGLLVGAKLAGIASQIQLIAVENDETFSERIITLCDAIIAKLRSCRVDCEGSPFPDIHITTDDFEIRENFAGERYGQFTGDGDRVTQLLKDTQDIQLDGTYTAKVFSGMMHDLESGTLQGKNVLFWHTFCADVQPQDMNSKKLSRAFYQFFD